MFRIFKQMNWFINSYKKKYMLSVVLLVLNNALILLPPIIIGRVTDGVNQGTHVSSGLFLMIGILMISVLLGYGVSYGWEYLIFAGSNQIGRDLRRMLMKKFLGQSPIFYEKNSTGSLMAKSTSDVSSMSDFAGFGVRDIRSYDESPIEFL